MPFLGSFCLLFALALAAYTLFAGIAVAWSDSARLRLAETARRAGMATFVAVSGSVVALVWAALSNDFSVDYIFPHSNRPFPTPYKLPALWSGPEGPLLFWGWLSPA